MSTFLKLESWPVTARFVETGTHLGVSVRAELELGYQEVCSFEISDEFFGKAQRAFQDERRVRLLHGSSPNLLPQVMAPDVPTTFWLDAHYSGTTLPSHDPMFGQCPLLAELAIIAHFPWKVPPLIAIDDAFLFEPATWEGACPELFNPDGMIEADWPTRNQVEQALPGYAFEFDGIRLYCTPSTIRPSKLRDSMNFD
ncbi:MAG: hypothetical protein ACKV0T_07695 [Planctomycetales bacterium]